MTGRQKTLAVSVCFGLISFLIITSLLQPGILDLITPTHSDFYRYFLMSQERWLPGSWLQPRPLMLAYLKVVGIFNQSYLVYLLLAVPALLFVSLIPYVTNRLGITKTDPMPAFVFFTAVFGSPYFYQIYQYDFGGMLSGLFAVLAIFFGVLTLKNNPANIRYLVFALVFCLASVETKPTYSLALLFLAFVGVVFRKDRASVLLFGGALLILLWTFIKDKIFGSPFVASADALSPYAVVISPIQNLQVLAFYFYHAFTVPLAFAAVVSLIALLICKEWQLAIISLLLCLVASAPMALLVNRQWESYAWYSTIVVALLIMFASDRLLALLRKSARTQTRVIATFLLLALLVSVVLHAVTRHPSVEWTLENQSYNRNVLRTLSMIEPATGDRKVLIVGVKGPYHPLKNTAFVQRQYPNLGKFDVLLRRSEEEWNRMSYEQTNGVYLDNLNLDQYSTVILVNAEGAISRRIPVSELHESSPSDVDVILVCGATAKQDATAVARTIECLNEAGEFKRAIEFGQNYLALGDTQPWLYYHLSKSYLNFRDPESALSMAAKALAIEPKNETFQQSVEIAKLGISREKSHVN